MNNDNLSKKYVLSDRLERAECIIRADALTLNLAISELKIKLKQYEEQTDLLHKARTELWSMEG